MYVLIACEESQRVCSAFREKGHEAYSCDILEPSGGHPEWHIQCDVLKILNPTETIMELNFDPYSEVSGMTTQKSICFGTMDGHIHMVPRWDLIIAHPPCTYLTNTGNRWFNIEKYGDKARERWRLREEAVDFFMQFVNADCDKIVIENPIGYMNTHYKKPTQIIHPYYFAESEEDVNCESKATCLWIKGLPPLTYEIKYQPRKILMNDGKYYSPWHVETSRLPHEERARARSKTFPGIAKAMAEQWG